MFGGTFVGMCLLPIFFCKIYATLCLGFFLNNLKLYFEALRIWKFVVSNKNLTKHSATVSPCGEKIQTLFKKELGTPDVN